MKRRVIVGRSLVFLLVLGACRGEIHGDGDTTDGSPAVATDAGSERDAGPKLDAGAPAPDSGALDGGDDAGRGEPDAGSPDDGLVRIDIDYGDYDAPSDVYDVNDNRSGIPPVFVSSPTFVSTQALRKEFSRNAKTANVEYRFEEHGYERPRELYTRFYVYPDGMRLRETTTVRIFWLPLSNGTGSSGGGDTDGTNGFSNAIGFAHRNDSPAPTGYNFFSYSYHLDRTSRSGDFQMTDEPVLMSRWNLIEGYVRVNTYADGRANRDGIMRYWVNGALAFERTDLRFTTTDENLIEGVGPLGYVIGTDLSGKALIYDGHVIVLGGMPSDVEAVRARHREHLGL